MKKLLSVLLVFALSLSLCSTAFAADHNSYGKEPEIGTEEDIQCAKDAYNSLNFEAKAIFEKALAADAELLEFHKEYVDPTCNISPTITDSAAMTTAAAVTVAADPMSILNAELALISLPSAVVYSLKAMGAGMVAAIADGPLPIGDILLAAATASAAIVIAANWNAVSSKWASIVSAFKKAFVASANNIISAFNQIRSDVNSELATNPCVTISGKVITVNGVSYNCTTKADSLTASQQRNKKYFPAVLYNETVYVDPLHSLETPGAKLFMYANSSKVGIWATSSSYAMGLCGGVENAIWHNTHASNEGYFFHYHHPSYKNFHCWYL